MSGILGTTGAFRFRVRADQDQPDSLGTFDLTNLGGEVHAPVVLFTPETHSMQRALWPAKDEKTNIKGPKCQADDGEKGEGDPGGDCATCPKMHSGCRVTVTLIGRVRTPDGKVNQTAAIGLACQTRPPAQRQPPMADAINLLASDMGKKTYKLSGSRYTTKTGFVLANLVVEEHAESKK